MTAVEYLVGMICTDVDMYDEEDNEKVEFWNAFKSCTDLSEYINKAKEMELEQRKEDFRKGWHGNKSKEWNCEFYLIKHINNDFKSE